MRQVDELMRAALADGVFPGGVLHVSTGENVLFSRAYGRASIFTGRRVTPDTVFDLASLTKPLATTLAVMKLVETGRLALDGRIGRVLPELQDSDKAAIRIRHLLYHTSGLPDYRPYYIDLVNLPPAARRNALHGRLASEPLVGTIGETVRYSDLGFMLLEWIVEKTAAMRLDRFVRKTVYRPLGLENLFFIDAGGPPPPGKAFAATENCPWRKKVLEGAVHDDNAWAVGGVAGHAGLFGTAGDLHRLLTLLLAAFHGRPVSPVFRPALVRTFFRRGIPGGRALGFDAPSAEGSSAGSCFSAQSVGHLGFTGTSFWMDLERRTIVILLTNRVHPSRANHRIRAFRPRLHDLVMTRLDRQGR